MGTAKNRTTKSAWEATKRTSGSGRPRRHRRLGLVGACVLGFGAALACGGKVLSGGESTDGQNAQGGTNGAGASGGSDGIPSHPDAPPFSCEQVESQQFDSDSMRPYSVSKEVEDQVESTWALMSSEARYGQMLGVPVGNRDYRDIERSPDVTLSDGRVLRGLRYRDSGRGVNLDAGQDNREDNMDNFATAFPTASLRGASWNVDLERRVGAAIADETAASRNNVLLAPCMNVLRHPYWGRSQETYGEDSYHVGRMATALTVGIQESVLACAKHFAANNIEKDRSQQNAIIDEQTLREVYGRHFEMVVQDGGVACIMAAYNKVNGVKSTQNRHLLRDILKAPVEDGGMGFRGFVLSDWWAMPGEQNTDIDAATARALTNEAVVAGLDVEVPWQIHYSGATLAQADQDLVQDAAQRVLTQKFRFQTAWESQGWGIKTPSSVLDGDSIAPNEAHEALAEEAAVESIVLLHNGRDEEPVLPLSKKSRIAVVGISQFFQQISSSVPKSCPWPMDVPQGSSHRRECFFDFAEQPALGDRGTSRVNARPERSFGPFAGISQVAGSGALVTRGTSADEAVDADAVVVVVGYTPGDEGEEYYLQHGGDRSSLDLPDGHAELVQRVLDLGKPTVIVIESGSIVNVPWLDHQNANQATIWAGYPGQRGGLALGRLLFGDANFSGKMPVAWPAEADVKSFKDSELETTMGYYFGYREFDRRQFLAGDPVRLVFPFGHGLSYSQFEYSNLVVPCSDASQEAILDVTIDITNTSSVDGDEVAMLFVKPPPKPNGIAGNRPWKELKSFARVHVPAGQTVTATLPLRVRDLRRWEGGADGQWMIDRGEYFVWVGKDAADVESTSNIGTFTIGE